MTGRLAKAAAFLRDGYFAVDARTLGLFRICFGLHLIANVYDRTKGSDAIAFYTNLGVMPNHYALFAPIGERIWSLLFAFSTPAEVQVAFFFILLVYLAYTLGYHTKLAQLLVVVCLLSLDNRNLALQNGGIVVTNVVAVWTAFLPLGTRFSIDHLRRSLAERRETTPAECNDRAPMVRSRPTYARLAFFGILFNFACIYFFNYAHKKGMTWKGGSAVHWVLWQNRIATVWASWLRLHESTWLSPAATWATLGIEASLPFFLLWPIAYRWARRVAFVGIFALHTGISLMMTLGPFSYSMMAFGILLIGKEDWDAADRIFSAWNAKRPRLLVVYESRIARLQQAARVLARLDVRRALQFAGRDDVDRLEPSLPGELAREPLCVHDPRRAGTKNPNAAETGWLTGPAAVRALLRALPFGVLYAWIVPASLARHWLENLPSPSSASGSERTSDYVEAPAARFKNGVVRVFGEIMAGVLLATVATQVSSDNWVIPDLYRVKRRPDFMREMVEYLRMPQGWSMFSPEAPRDDGTLVIDAVLSDGRHLDPRKQAPPDFEAAYHGPWFDDQQWCDWDLRMKFDGNRHLHPYFRDYIARLDRLHSWKQKATIRSFDVYWVNNQAPPPGSTQPYNLTRQLLFSWGTKP
jgi:hypothetical protein